MNKKALSERDICTKFITPALVKAGWDVQTQIREEVGLTKGRVIVSGRVHRRGETKRADYLLHYKPNMPLAIGEAKDNNHTVGAGMQQGLGYAEILKDVPFVFSSNGDGFLFHDRTVKSGPVEKELTLDEFPSPEELLQRYCASRDIPAAIQPVVTQDYYPSPENKTPRYYQLTAINRTIEAIAKGRDRILLVMATGTGKTFVAFQIIWRLWKSKARKRILFLADRNILVDQARTNDFKPFGAALTKISNREVDKSYEIYLSLYQAVTGTEEEQNIYKQFANLGGGFLVFGIAEKTKGAFEHIGLDAEQLKHLEVTTLNKSVREYIEPPHAVKCHRVKRDGHVFIVVEIPSALETLLLAKKQNDSANLYTGRIYTRTTACESAEVRDNHELRRILERITANFTHKKL
jgi:type I site-specific restriction endonuclease